MIVPRLQGLGFLKRNEVLHSSFLVDVNAMAFAMPRALFPALAIGAMAALLGPTAAIAAGGIACIAATGAVAAWRPAFTRYVPASLQPAKEAAAQAPASA
ncbi:MAG TPA: hypothetical protein VLK58_27535 [Conexibacter sp.]|nr:hypothetical protein [Conexibacter sp.]